MSKSCQVRGMKTNIGTILFNELVSASNTCDDHDITKYTFWKRKLKSVDSGCWKPGFSLLEWEVTDK